MVYRADVKVDKKNDNIRTVSVVRALIEKHGLLTDKDIMNTSLSDLYEICDNTKYYINQGYARQLNNDTYRVEVYN